MKRTQYSWIIMGMLVLVSGHFSGVFANIKQETQLNNAQAEIDKHSGAWSHDEHINRLAEQFKVPASTIDKLNTKNQGWGAVTIELAMAWELNTMHPQKFPMMTASLDRIEELRSQGKDWGYIAKNLDFGLTSVVKVAQKSAKQLRKDDLAMVQKNVEHAKVEENRRIVSEEHKIAQDNRADQQ